MDINRLTSHLHPHGPTPTLPHRRPLCPRPCPHPLPLYLLLPPETSHPLHSPHRPDLRLGRGLRVAGDVSEVEEVSEDKGDELLLKLQYCTEPPLEAKLFVGNFVYDMDSERLATLFDQAADVKVVEVIYNRETDQSRGFGFVTMRMVEVVEQATEMLHCNDDMMSSDGTVYVLLLRVKLLVLFLSTDGVNIHFEAVFWSYVGLLECSDLVPVRAAFLWTHSG